MAGYKNLRTNVYSIQENFIETGNSKYYLLNEADQEAIDEASEDGIEFNTINGFVDAVQLLYSNASVSVLNITEPDEKYNDPEGIRVRNDPEESKRTFYDEIKLIIPEGLRNPQSLDTNRPSRLCIGPRRECVTGYRVKTRAMLTKMPGWYMTAYQNVQFFMQQLMTEQQYRAILDDFIRVNDNQGSQQKYQQLVEGYNFTNGVPKYKMLVKMAPNATEARRDFIANGIRSYFRDDQIVLLDLETSMVSITSSLALFQIFVGLIGAIALALAFFLLLISTTQNIKENVWEYGCLRAMGLTMDQGMRCFMYEQYSLILSSLILGTIVGLILACVVTAQFFLFLEFPFKLTFPYELVVVMYALAVATTFFAVYIPVSKVNKQRVAQTIKGSA
uniref:ABC3 transporter permease C-terminal domain-containing protein n=1 Tax=Strombidium rassoulzadegani TaxID=1082188 RepID=A0A7S3CJT1_9SPIT|mmetsp:Transcript_13591/g.23133  ORF Transcript_13591/g.23133 Transcript_13591/m.23133 type:complete len:390 (+) Transcript_13591:1054-2223(+)